MSMNKTNRYFVSNPTRQAAGVDVKHPAWASLKLDPCTAPIRIGSEDVEDGTMMMSLIKRIAKGTAVSFYARAIPDAKRIRDAVIGENDEVVSAPVEMQPGTVFVPSVPRMRVDSVQNYLRTQLQVPDVVTDAKGYLENAEPALIAAAEQWGRLPRVNRMYGVLNAACTAIEGGVGESGQFLYDTAGQKLEACPDDQAWKVDGVELCYHNIARLSQAGVQFMLPMRWNAFFLWHRDFSTAVLTGNTVAMMRLVLKSMVTHLVRDAEREAFKARAQAVDFGLNAPAVAATWQHCRLVEDSTV